MIADDKRATNIAWCEKEVYIITMLMKRYIERKVRHWSNGHTTWTGREGYNHAFGCGRGELGLFLYVGTRSAFLRFP